MSLASESAEEEETRLSRRRGRDRARRAAQYSQATKNCRRSETAEARERRDRDRASRFRKRGGTGDTIIQRDVKQMISLIQTALIIVLALQKMSLATFHIASLHVHVSTTCFIHHAAYFIPLVHVPTITCLLFRTLYTSSCPLHSWIAPARQQCHAFS